MQFTYKALRKGKIVKANIEASSESDVAEYLKRNGFMPVSIQKHEIFLPEVQSFFQRINFSDVVLITRQLSIMLNAGLTLLDSFTLLKKQVTKISLRKMIDDIEQSLKAGDAFSVALRKYNWLFSDLYISLVKSGEASGKLNDVLLKLAENLEKEREFKAKLKNALIYPVIIMIGMAGVIFIMMTFVLPKLLGLYKDFNVELPFTTKLLIVVSDIFANYWVIILVGVTGIAIILKTYFKTSKGKEFIDRVSLSLPYLKSIIAMSNLVDSTRTLSILITSGISILDALEIVIESTTSITYQRAFKNMYKQVEKGFTLSSAMDAEGIFPPILVQMTNVGEQTGKLDDAFLRISNYFEMESELAIKAATTLIEPAILVVLGFGVGFIVLSVITPIYNLSSSIK